MATDFKGLTVRFGADTREFDTSVRGINSALKTAQANIKNLNSALKFDSSNVTLLNQKLKSLDDESSVLKARLASLQQQASQSDMGSQKWASLQQQIASTQTKLNNVSSQSEGVKRAIADIGVSGSASIKKFDDALEQVNSELKNVQRQMVLNPNNMKLATQESKLLKQALELAENKMKDLISAQTKLGSSKVGTAEWQAYDRQIDAAANDVKNLRSQVQGTEGDTQKLSKSASGLSFGFLAGAGMAAFQSVKGAITGIIGETDNAVASMKSFESNMKLAGQSSSQIDAVSKRIQSYAQATVYSTSDMLSTVGLLTTSGVKNADNLAIAMGNISSAAENPQQALKSLSMQMTQVNGKGFIQTMDFRIMQEQAAGPMKMVQERLMELNHWSPAQFQDALSNGKISADQFNQALVDVGGASSKTGKMLQENAATPKSFGQAMDVLSESATNAMIPAMAELQKSLIPLITSFADKLPGAVTTAINVVEGIVKFVQANKDWIAPLAVGIGAFVTVLATVSAATKAWAAAQRILNAVMSANPYVMIAGLIAGLVSALVYFFTQTKQGQEIWQNFMDWLKNAWTSISAFFTKLWNDIVNVFNTTLQTIQTTATNVWTAISTFFTNIWTSITTTVSNAINGIANIISTVWTIVSGVFMSIWTPIAAFFTSVWTTMSTLVTTVVTAIVTFITEQFTAIQTFFTTIFTAISTFIGSIWDGIKSIFVNVLTFIVDLFTKDLDTVKQDVTNIFNSISAFISTIWNGIATLFTTIWSAIINLFGSSLNNVNNLVTTVFDAVKSFINLVWDGIVIIIRNAWNAITSAISNALNTAKSIITNVWNSIKSFISDTIETIKSTISNGFNIAQNVINNIWNSIKNIISNAINVVRSSISNGMNVIPNIIDSAMNAARNGFSNAINAIANVAGTIGGRVANAFRNIGGLIMSAIGDLGYIGQNIVSGILNGMGNLGGRIWNYVMNAVSSLGNIGSSILKHIGLSGGLSVNAGNYGAAINQLYNVKSAGGSPMQMLYKMASSMPDLASVMNSNVSTTTMNINVKADGPDASNIAREIEKVIVRRTKGR